MNVYTYSPAQNYNTFNGLWGTAARETSCYNPLGAVELFRIDRFYPFADDSDKVIADELKAGQINGVQNPHGEFFPKFKLADITIEEKLPFTRAEYEAYKLKDGMKLKKANLTTKEEQIEDYMYYRTLHGLNMYRNMYKKTQGLTGWLKNLIK